MAILTDEQQSFLGPILRGGMPTCGACLAAVVRINLYRHALMQKGFIGNHALQFGKAPLGVSGIGTPLLFARTRAFLPLCALTDVFQVFQTDQAMRVLFH